MAERSLQSLHGFLKRNDTSVSSGGSVVSFSHDHGSGPVLCLVHGYPQSSYMWRHTVPLLKDKISLFAVELPGYGISSLPPKHDKRTVGRLIMEALQSVFGASRAVIWCGHDRGGRIGHRLLVDHDPVHNIKAAILIDIVPTLEQWRAFANPLASVAYYHWSMLATPMAPRLIELMDAREYYLSELQRTRGRNEAGAARFAENDAEELYAQLFSRPDTIAGACGDYAAGAKEDVEEQKEDQQAGRKIEIPTLVIYSASNLGRMHDVDAVWPRWANGVLETVGVPDEIGHYIPEEAPERVVELVTGWIDKHGQE